MSLKNRKKIEAIFKYLNTDGSIQFIGVILG